MVRRLLIEFAATLCSAVAFSQQNATLPEIISFMSTNDCQHCFMLTNDLDSLIGSSSDVMERSTCKLLKASILLDYSESMADSSSFDDTTNICREIETDLSGFTVWQRIGALCKFTNAMIEDGHPEIAFAASTNLLTVFQCSQYVEVDTNVWDVLFKPGGLELMPPCDFIRANAAASRHRMDGNADISPYTNGLPQAILNEIVRR